MTAHVGLTIDSEQAKFSALLTFCFRDTIRENLTLGRKCAARRVLERRLV